MRAPLSWLREYAALPVDLDGRTLAEALIRAGLEVETVDHVGADVSGPLVIGKVALSQRNRATAALTVADAGRLASRSRLERDPQLALLMAREAMHIDVSPEMWT